MTCTGGVNCHIRAAVADLVHAEIVVIDVVIRVEKSIRTRGAILQAIGLALSLFLMSLGFLDPAQGGLFSAM